jgi:hypothetical protein
MPPKRDKRYTEKLIDQCITQRIAPSRLTTTRQRVSVSSKSTKEVTRQRYSNPERQINVEPLLDSPANETAVGVEEDGMEDPANKVYEPLELSKEHTQVRLLEFSTLIITND